MSNSIAELLEYAFFTAGKIDRPSAKSAAYLEIAEVFLKSGLKSRCLDISAEALKIADQVKQPEEKAKILARIASVLLKTGENIKGKETFTRAILLAGATETTAQKTSALFDIALEYAEAGLVDEAGKILVEMHEVIGSAEIGIDTAYELINISTVYSEIGQINNVGEILQEALEISEELKDNWFKAERLVQIAEKYSEIGLNDKAERVLEKADLAASQIEEMSQPYFWSKIIDVYLVTGNILKSLELLTKFREIVEKDSEVYSKSESLIDLAEKYSRLNEITTSVMLLELVLETNKGTEDAADKISIFADVSGIFSVLGQTEKALEIADRAYEICKKLKNKKTAIYLLGNLALLYAGLKALEKTRETVAGIVKIASDNTAKNVGLGEIAMDLADSGEYQFALQIAQLIQEPKMKAETLYNIAASMTDTNYQFDDDLKNTFREIVNSTQIK